MSVNLSYPGVYIREVPSGNRTIVGVATSITAFLGVASRGPADEAVSVARFADFERTFGTVTRNSGLGYAVRDFFRNGGGETRIVRVVHKEQADPSTGGAAAPGTGAATPAKKPAERRTWEVDLGSTSKLVIVARGPGAWANALGLSVESLSAAEKAAVAEALQVDPNDLFNLKITDGDRGTELHRNLTLTDGPRRLDQVLRADSGFVSVDGSVPDLTGEGAKRRPEDGPFGTQTVAGADGDAPGSADYDRALAALEKTDLVNLVCIPPVTPLAEVAADVWTAAARHCADHRAFLIIDPPAAATTGEAVTTWAAGLNLGKEAARNAALFFPRLERSDPLRAGARTTVAPCGAVAGIFARTDATRGVWKAPAGIDAAVADADPAVILTDDQNGRLNPIGINCIRRFRDAGTVVWGARTRRGADALADDYKYIPVRRTALFIEETLYRSTQWAVFEPNDEPLWSQIRNSIGAFMQDLFRRGAFQGATPRDAYFVLCGHDTTTQYDIDRGIVNIRVGFAPLKPAEFVVISIEQKTAQPS